MPKMKTHHWAGVTLSLKNCFGCVPGRVYGWPKNVLHWAGLNEAIVDVSAVRPRPADRRRHRGDAGQRPHPGDADAGRPARVRGRSGRDGPTAAARDGPRPRARAVTCARPPGSWARATPSASSRSARTRTLDDVVRRPAGLRGPQDRLRRRRPRRPRRRERLTEPAPTREDGPRGTDPNPRRPASSACSPRPAPPTTSPRRRAARPGTRRAWSPLRRASTCTRGTRSGSRSGSSCPTTARELRDRRRRVLARGEAGQRAQQPGPTATATFVPTFGTPERSPAPS